MSGSADAIGRLADLPSSAKLVFTGLSYEGPLTASQLEKKTRLESPTVCAAINRLETAGIVTAETDHTDPRKAIDTLTADVNRCITADD
ncbi:MAG: helix-turn-helix domain-containing protein [Halobacteriales archaeon]|nr:helix-turn-helix domain-containing protein [Halobacteriales archaeon]